MSKIEVPDGCPCDFRATGVPPGMERCRHCGRAIGGWLACPYNPGEAARKDEIARKARAEP
jgi:hypothetical protein